MNLGKVLCFDIFIFLAQKLRNKTLWVWHVAFFFPFLVLKKFDKFAPKDLGSFLSFFYFLFVSSCKSAWKKGDYIFVLLLLSLMNQPILPNGLQLWSSYLAFSCTWLAPSYDSNAIATTHQVSFNFATTY